MKTYLTIKDEEGIVRPKAILATDDESGLVEVEKFATTEDTIVRVKIIEVEEL